MQKSLEYIICDKYINKDLKAKHGIEYYLIKISQKDLVIFSDKTYRFEIYTDKHVIVKLDFLIEMISYRLENLSDCKTTMNKFDKSVLVEYNENNTLLLIKIVNDVIKEYFENIKTEYYALNLDNMLKSSYTTKNDNILIKFEQNTTSLTVDEIKENMFKCFKIEGVGMLCGKIIFDNVFNYSRSLKNKIDDYNLEEYLTNVKKQESLNFRYNKLYSIVARKFKN